VHAELTRDEILLGAALATGEQGQDDEPAERKLRRQAW
jgi:hypothetical protein